MAPAFSAFSEPDYVAEIPLSGGSAIYEFYMDRTLLPECQNAGSHPGGLIANIKTPKGIVPYGTGCWIARMGGDIWIAVKSFDDGVVRETVIHNSKLKPTNSSESQSESKKNTCLSDGESVDMVGKIRRETFPGKPNYESVENGDEPVTVWIFTINQPSCVLGESPEDGEHYFIEDISKFQLVINPTQYKNTRSLENEVRVRGQLFQASTTHHYTKALIDVGQIDLVPTN